MFDSMSRRQLLQGAVAAAAGVTPMLASLADDSCDHPWIDAHSHIWTRDVKRYPLVAGKTVDDLAPPSFTTEELLELAHKNGVGKVVLIAHSVFYLWDNSYMIDAVKQYPNAFRIVGMVDDRQSEPGQAMRKLLADKVTGFRITPFVYNDNWLEQPGMHEMWQTAADTGQNMCCLINPSDLPSIDAMCRKYPDTPVVIDHFARIGVDGTFAEDQIKDLCALAKHKKTTVKVSAYYALGQKNPPHLELIPMIRRLLDCFGPERLMWASDAPYQIVPPNTYADSIALIRDHIDFLSDGDKQHLLKNTAQRVFFYM